MRITLALLALIGSDVRATPSPSDPSSPAARLLGAALAGGNAYAIVASLTDRVGQRLAGSPAAERAVEWALVTMSAAGLKNVHREPVRVPRWVRGEESVEVLAPNPQPMHATALGGSVGTPAAGLTAEVVEANSLEEIAALGDRARGRIVLINKAMTRSPTGDGYSAVARLRGGGAVAAAKVGAVGALIRSAGTGAYRLPHTGATLYDPAVTQIPFAALATEDAELLHRLLAAGGPVKVRMRLGCRTEGAVESANVIGELPGRDRPGEVVLLGAHLDSWDLGTGAIDDGAGVAIVLEAARLVAALRSPPRRTIRVVLFMNEEHGLSGGHAYAERHQKELGTHVAALEADSGAGRPLGFHVVGDEAAVKRLRALTGPLSTIRSSDVTSAHFGGSDLVPLQPAGVPIVGVTQDMSTYFDWHHSAADTLDKIDPLELSLNAAAVAVIAQALADAADTLPRLPDSARQVPSWAR
jgi:hypothetical protein